MTMRLTAWVDKHSLAAYFLCAYAISWAIQIPLALQARGVLQTHISFAVHYLSGFGPMLSALIVTGLIGGARGLRELIGRMSHWRVGPVWWVVAVTPLILYGLAVPVLCIAQGQCPDFNQLGEISFMPSLGLAALPLWILTFGIGEETGWRGFALPRLQNGRSALSATVILWCFWALWHLPVFFYAYPASILPGFLIGLLAGAITFTWLYNSSRSILIVAVWHGLFNFVTACIPCKSGAIAAVISTLVMVWSVWVVIQFKPPALSRSEKPVM